MGVLHRLVPRSLSSRIALILIAGLFGAQIFTSTIWFDRRQRALMDAPNRIVAVRIGDALKLLAADPASPEKVLAPLQTESFRAAVVSAPDRSAAKIGIDANAIRIIRKIIEDEAGSISGLRVTRAEILGDDGQIAGMSALLCAREPRGRYTIFVAAGQRSDWLRVDATEGQHGAGTHCLTTIADYVLRIYLARMVIIVVLALLAVRLALQPLKRMIAAAEALGHNMHQPPLATDGPDEVRQAAEAFNRMQGRLVEAMQERSRFLAAVSHDLRSPITRLRLRTELLRQEDLRGKFRKDLEEMEVLVNATLAFVEEGESRLEPAPVDLNGVLRDLVEDLREQGADIALTGESREPLWGFGPSLRRCFQNLADNALRYAGAARILVEDTPEAVTISVIDEGPGIPEDRLQEVFEPFARVEGSRNPASGGVGLGLSIVKTVVGAHHGRVELANRPGGGLLAKVTLPRDDIGWQRRP